MSAPPPELPAALRARLEGADAGPWADEALVLATTDRLRRPHFALLSYAELCAAGLRHLCFATYSDTHTADHLRVRGAASFALPGAGEMYYLKTYVLEIGGGLPGHAGWALFEAELEEWKLDRADPQREDGAQLAGGLAVRRARPSPGLRPALWEAALRLRAALVERR